MTSSTSDRRPRAIVYRGWYVLDVAVEFDTRWALNSLKMSMASRGLI